MSPKQQSLVVWMNEVKVGVWTVTAKGVHEFVYDPAWMKSEYRRSLSESMNISLPKHTGLVVSNYFENLLPDNKEIRVRLQRRFGTPGLDAMSLLTAIGRDCVGAVALTPTESLPENATDICGRPVTKKGIEKILLSIRSAPSPIPLGVTGEDDAFRISIAGAQDKTGLTYANGQWMIPSGSTATTHILKLPLEPIEHKADLSDSVDNEYFCLKLLQYFDIPVAQASIQKFGSQRVLCVERFDRKWIDNQLLRLPQEDFCQILGLGPDQKYQAYGGPGVYTIMEILRGSAKPNEDRKTFFKTQILFWMLAATDGHAKNFSIKRLAGDKWQLTPIYDVLSTFPYHGKKYPKGLDSRKISMAMGLLGTQDIYYKWDRFCLRYLENTARKTGFTAQLTTVLEEIKVKLSGFDHFVNGELKANKELNPATVMAIADGFKTSLPKLLVAPD